MTILKVKRFFFFKWGHHPSCRQTKLWIQTPGAVGRLPIRLDRGKLGQIIQALTGHNYLK